MTRDMAKAMCQHFMDARLIENAADRNSNLFKERGVFVLTPKGLHVLERFISKNGINAESLTKVFLAQPICMKLLHLERRSSDDEIIISQAVVTTLFRRFAGRAPNYLPEQPSVLDTSQEYHERAKGIPLQDVMERSPGLLGRGTQTTFKHCFQAVTALEWLCDFTSIVGRDEAAEMAAHFVRFGLIALVSDKRKGNDSAIIFTVRGNAPAGNSPVSVRPTNFVHFPSLLTEHPLIASGRVPLYIKGDLSYHGRGASCCAVGYNTRARHPARFTKYVHLRDSETRKVVPRKERLRQWSIWWK